MSVHPIPVSIRAGIFLALTAILLGFVLGGAFGGIEPTIKARLAASADAVLATAYSGDVAAKDAVLAKSWTYLQRAHLHGGSIGTAALAAIAILVLTTRVGRIAQVSAVAFVACALIYATFWLAAGFTAPAMGSTAAAKKALEWLALPGAGLAIIGVVGTMVAVFVEKGDAAPPR
jgi:carbonic anhydrase/acetyltransferase-like protein (isoleucine patch superfamily)